MVLLTTTATAKRAIEEYCRVNVELREESRKNLTNIETGSHIEHQQLVDISRYLVKHCADPSGIATEWRLETLLKSASVYQPPPPPKPEPTAQYKALMQRLREQDEQRQYERMTNPLAPETFGEHFPNATTSFGHGMTSEPHEVDEVTYADVNRQMILIINVLVSIICTSVAVWMAARRWSVPQRLALSFSSSTLVAVAEVAIYMGYIRRIQESKTKEKKLIEKKEIVDTWVIDAKATTTGQQAKPNDSTRSRKGKHR
ncbi:unnamed protein product [Zymoseptoria tritici ST99CH_1A5]|uniref:Uncharacterized protein n=4 Tax=Zymoseptoria tritici TaxID=1047171 RepID=F9XDY3_ZYMTI|nr:uncharacterized protein MYCGRDRAFT_43297 [Zymoseptoria tritici IPO323]SMQ51943.1 unnamed protein product [Zymoseptoria tritici ST99CH_3D7]SMR54484.1 unnamed protein product [Zymoseptoria tritici ST99CH_1E4]SMR56401.1 unnamed protein product [Zymoseptoria tritici ST99CH_3D1]SMY25586.1 unnamed protein product [Zymoseptoria tritici ST99CH_1A5]EGP86573.1 hypothetical protein MYCGRDRAFT_43297 [Zymoseptoria tritici IPO323]